MHEPGHVAITDLAASTFSLLHTGSYSAAVGRPRSYVLTIDSPGVGRAASSYRIATNVGFIHFPALKGPMHDECPMMQCEWGWNRLRQLEEGAPGHDLRHAEHGVH